MVRGGATILKVGGTNSASGANYSQIMPPVRFGSKSGGLCPPAPIGAPPMVVVEKQIAVRLVLVVKLFIVTRS